jgi:hypothetical protein
MWNLPLESVHSPLHLWMDSVYSLDVGAYDMASVSNKGLILLKITLILNQ